MNLQGAYELSEVLSPAAAPLPDITLKISPSVGKAYNHYAGTAKGYRASLNDLNAFVYYLRGGWITRNTRYGLGTRQMHGLEDGTWNERR